MTTAVTCTALHGAHQDACIGNAGLGSNLTVKGAVECDASVMVGDGAFGAVGAVSGALRYPYIDYCLMACRLRLGMMHRAAAGAAVR